MYCKKELLSEERVTGFPGWHESSCDRCWHAASLQSGEEGGGGCRVSADEILRTRERAVLHGCDQYV